MGEDGDFMSSFIDGGVLSGAPVVIVVVVLASFFIIVLCCNLFCRISFLFLDEMGYDDLIIDVVDALESSASFLLGLLQVQLLLSEFRSDLLDECFFSSSLFRTRGEVIGDSAVGDVDVDGDADGDAVGDVDGNGDGDTMVGKVVVRTSRSEGEHGSEEERKGKRR